ncbi:2Fe-2S iron-sulfur cluster-binding protein [Sphingobium naphthae]|nr:2Fe-2S iron-sulfur cluster-binding protein [Sphingobium naphthae]
MTYDISVAESDIHFSCGEDETILDAAERAGYTLPYSCRKGVCASCEGGLRGGSVTIGRSATASSPAENVKFCIARPRSPLEIAPAKIERGAPPARKTFQATIHKIDWPEDNVAIIQLRLPIGRRAPFLAGQYVQLVLPSGETRNYSLANAPQDNASPELHVRRVPGGLFSDRVLGTLHAGDRIRIEMPYGMSVLDGSDAPIVMLATGTGFAPLKSMVEDLIRQGAERPVHLFWGAMVERDLYLASLARQWEERLPWFRFTPVLSHPEDGWSGQTGLIQDAALAAYPDLSAHQVYACGNPAMVDSAHRLLTDKGGLPDAAFHADAFVPSSGNGTAEAPPLSG